MKGSTPFGYARTSAGVVSAMEAMNQIGTSTHRADQDADQIGQAAAEQQPAPGACAHPLHLGGDLDS